MISRLLLTLFVVTSIFGIAISTIGPGTNSSEAAPSNAAAASLSPSATAARPEPTNPPAAANSYPLAQNNPLLELDFWIKLVSFVGACLALVRFGVDLYRWFMDRPRIEIRILSMQSYALRYGDESSDGLEFAGWIEQQYAGKARKLFSIVEFEIENHYGTPVTASHLKIENWIYSDHYEKSGAYPAMRDYRAYDLHDRTPANLGRHFLLSPHEVRGWRVEIYEYTYAKSAHSPISLPERKEFALRVMTAKASLSKRINVPPPHAWAELDRIDLWSGEDLIAHPLEYPPEGGFHPI